MLVLIRSKDLIRLSFCSRHHPFRTYVAFSEKVTFIPSDEDMYLCVPRERNNSFLQNFMYTLYWEYRTRKQNYLVKTIANRKPVWQVTTHIFCVYPSRFRGNPLHFPLKKTFLRFSWRDPFWCLLYSSSDSFESSEEISRLSVICLVTFCFFFQIYFIFYFQIIVLFFV